LLKITLDSAMDTYWIFHIKCGKCRQGRPQRAIAPTGIFVMNKKM